MSDSDTEALAAQLFALYVEALGFNPMEMNFVNEQPKVKTAFIMLAQFVEAGFTPKDETPDHR